MIIKGDPLMLAHSVVTNGPFKIPYTIREEESTSVHGFPKGDLGSPT